MTIKSPTNAYFFIIPNKKLLIYQIFAYGIVILNLLGFYLYKETYNLFKINIFYLFILFLLVVVYDVFQYKKRGRLTSISLVILCCGIFWMRVGFYQFLLLNVFFWALYTISKRRLIVAVTETTISYPSFPKKNIQWGEVDHVILKDDMLTIQLKNNKVYQHLVEYPDGETDEQQFNEFCVNKLQIK